MHIDYMPLLANNSHGRYPKELENGRFTTEIYESQVDRVLHHLFIAIPYHLDKLRANSDRLDQLLGMGNEFGYW